MDFHFGEPIITTREISTQESLSSAAQKIQEIQKKFIMDLAGPGGLQKMDVLFKNKEIPSQINNIILSKVEYIQALMGASMVEAAKEGSYRELSYSLEREKEGNLKDELSGVFRLEGRGTTDRDPLGRFVLGSTIGSFIQDIAIFKSAPKAAAGPSSPRPDILPIMTELKASLSFKELTSGGITAAVKGAAIDSTEEERKAKEFLVEKNQRKNIAKYQMYQKMRNLLIIKVGMREHMAESQRKELLTPRARGNVVRRAAFEAIILFIELLLDKVDAWIERGFTKEAETQLMKQGKRPKTFLMGQHGLFVTPGKFKKTQTSDGVIYEQGFDVHMSLIDEATSKLITANQVSAWQKFLSTLGQLYLARYDILDTISGPGKGKEAVNFFATIKGRNIGAIVLPNVDVIKTI